MTTSSSLCLRAQDYSDEQVLALTEFQERFFRSTVIREKPLTRDSTFVPCRRRRSISVRKPVINHECYTDEYGYDTPDAYHQRMCLSNIDIGESHERRD